MRYTITVDVDLDALKRAREDASERLGKGKAAIKAAIEAECGWLEQSGITVVSVDELTNES